MTDFDMTKLCSDAIGEFGRVDRQGRVCVDGHVYDPLHNNAQAMELVKKFALCIWRTYRLNPPEIGWNVREAVMETWDKDLNRAIVECVARSYAAKGGVSCL